MRTFLYFASFAAALIAISSSENFAYAQAGRGGSGQVSGTNVAVIDINFVFKNHLRFKKAMDDIKKDVDAFEAHVRQEQAKAAKINEKMTSYSAGSAEYRRYEKELARLASDMQVDMQLRRKDFLEQEAKVYFNAYNEVFDHVSEFARRNGIGLVLRFTADEMDPTKRESVLKGVNKAVVYQDRLDITEQILGQLNRGVAPSSVGSRPSIPRRNPNR